MKKITLEEFLERTRTFMGIDMIIHWLKISIIKKIKSK